MATSTAGLPALAAPPEGGDPAVGTVAEDEFASPSEADQKAAKQFAQDGRELFFKEEYGASIKAFERAYALVPDPNLLFNISTAYEKLERYDEAIEYLDRYAAEAPETEADGIQKKRAQLEAKNKAHEESAVPTGHRDDVSAAGTGEPGATGGPEGPEPGPAPEPGPEPEPEQPPIMGALGWSLAGLSVVSLGVGIGFGASSSKASKDGEGACNTVDGQSLCPASVQSDLDKAANRALVADVAFGVAAASAVATAVVVGVRLSRRKKAGKADVALTGTGATLRLRF